MDHLSRGAEEKNKVLPVSAEKPKIFSRSWESFETFAHRQDVSELSDASSR